MTNFKKYTRTNIAEMTPWTIDVNMSRVSISQADIENGSPKEGDMIARNPINHDDQWLVASQYFKDNFTEFGKQESSTIPDYQQRVIQERNDLKIKISKLSDFVNRDEDELVGINPSDIDDLKEQLHIMRKYYDILNKRIGKFSA